MNPNEPFDFRAFGIALAIAAIPAAFAVIIFGALAGRVRSWLRPTWAFPPRPWNGFTIIFAFGAFQVAVGLLADSAHRLGWFATQDELAKKTLNAVAARAIAVPLFFLFASVGIVNTFGPIRVPSARRLAGWIALGAAAWLPITLLTFAVHAATIAVKQELGGPIDTHPLAKLHPEQDRLGGWLFAASVCVFTPWFEEFIFRGLLLPWVLRAGYRPWLLVGWSLLFAGMTFGNWDDPHFGAVAFIALGAVALGLCQLILKSKPKRTILGIVSTSLLFAAVHSSVWPSPIPLFVLALGLGYLTARTGSIIPAVVVHGLFNGVSFVLLLRQPG